MPGTILATFIYAVFVWASAPGKRIVETSWSIGTWRDNRCIPRYPQGIDVVRSICMYTSLPRFAATSGQHKSTGTAIRERLVAYKHYGHACDLDARNGHFDPRRLQNHKKPL